MQIAAVGHKDVCWWRGRAVDHQVTFALGDFIVKTCFPRGRRAVTQMLGTIQIDEDNARMIGLLMKSFCNFVTNTRHLRTVASTAGIVTYGFRFNKELLSSLAVRRGEFTMR